MALKLATVVLQHLKGQPDVKLTARQIANWVFESFPVECQAKKQRSQYVNTDAELVKQLVSEIGSRRSKMQKRCPALKTTEGRRQIRILMTPKTPAGKTRRARASASMIG